MPIPGGGGGGVGSGGANEDVSKLREAIAIRKENIKAIDDELGALGDLHPEYAKLSAERTKELDEIKKLKAPMEEYNKNLLKEVQNINKDTIAHKQHIATLKAVGSEILKVANYVKSGAPAYYTYNLAVQHTIDTTGKFVDQSAKARQEFDSFRHALNLTRDASLKFADVWSQGMRLGVTNAQLKEMVGNLQKIHGQTKGLEMAREVMATPVTRQTMQGVTAGRGGSVVEAMRMGNMQQMQAIATTRGAGGRDQRTADAVRFERATAKFSVIADDLKAGAQAFAAAGFGPEASALLGPVTDIAGNVVKIVENTGMTRQLLMKGMPSLGSLPGLLGKIPGLGGGGGGAAGGLGGLVKGGLIGGGLIAAGAAAKMGMDWAANKMEAGGHGTAAKMARVGGHALRGAGVLGGVGYMLGGAHGAAIGGAVGAVGGGAIGIAEQFGSEILKYAGRFGSQMGKYLMESVSGVGKFLDGITGGLLTKIGDAAGKLWGKITDAGGYLWGKVTGAAEYLSGQISYAAGILGETLFGREEGDEKADIGDLLKSQGTLTKTVQENLARLGPTLEKLPEAVRAAISTRAGEVGVGTVGRGDVEATRGAFTKQITTSLDRMATDLNKDRAEIVKTRDENVKQAVARGATPEQLQEIETVAQEALNSIEQAAQEQIRKLDVGRGARLEMQRGETRRGQVGMEREAAAGRFKRTGAITGDVGEITRYQEEINKTYAKEGTLLEEAKANVNKEWDTQDKILSDRIEANKTNKELVAQLELQLRDNERQRADANRNLDNQKELLRINEMEARVEAARVKSTAYQLTSAYRRAEAQRTRSQAELEFAKERGAAPAEVGRIAGEKHAASAEELAKHTAAFPKALADLNEGIANARGRGDEGEAVRLEGLVYDLKQKGVDLARAEFADRIQAATAERQLRMEQLGIQKSILEAAAGTAARMGESAKAQAEYSQQIVAAAEEDLKLAQETLAVSKAKGESGKPLLDKQLAVTQKESALKDARLAAATKEQDIGMGILAGQKSILEAQAGSAARMGASGKVQAGYQEQIVKASEKDLELARSALAEAERMHLSGQPLLDKQLAVTQKEAALKDARVAAATKEQDVRMGVIGVEKSALEIMRDYASATGQSWRVQMQYQSQIIAKSREDLELARSAYEAAKESGLEGQQLAEKRLAVIQKEAALGQANMGKQRDFLEKAVAAGFGMGGGSKAQPNINPRIFGEVIKDVRGQLWQGAPKTMEEIRQAQGGNIRGNIGIGGGGINAAPGRPGVNLAGAGGAGAAAAVGGPAAAMVAEGVDVSGKIAIEITSDNPMFGAKVNKLAVIAQRNQNQPGAMG